MNKTAYVYVIRHIASGDCYVGCTTAKNSRWARHRYLLRSGKHHAKRLQSLWSHQGEDAFIFEIRESIPHSTRELRVARELYWIETIGTLNTHISGGEAFTLRPSDAEHRRNLALATIAADPELRDFLTNRGQELAKLARSPEARAAMASHTKRRWKDPKEAERLRAGLQHRWDDPEERRRAAERITSEDYKEVRQQRAASLAATWADPKRNQTLIESRKKRWADPDAKAKQAEKMRAIWALRRAQKQTP